MLILYAFIMSVNADQNSTPSENPKPSQGYYIGETGFALSFLPEKPGIIVIDSVVDINVSCLAVGTNATPISILLKVEMEHEDIAQIEDTNILFVQCGESSTSKVIRVKGIFLGHTWINMWYANLSSITNIKHLTNVSQGQVHTVAYERTNISEWIQLENVILIGVKRKMRLIDTVFTVLLISSIILTSLLLGCQLQLEVIKEVLWRPFGPTISLFCQFIIMPLVREIFNHLNIYYTTTEAHMVVCMKEK